MNQFKEMWIPCTESEYPEVKQLLEGMGYEIRGLDFLKQPTWYTGITVFKKGTYVANICNLLYHPTVTLPELRLMAAQPDPQPTEPDNLAALETLFANFIEAVAEMRTAQLQYYKTPASRRPEALGIKLKLERQVDEMIEDVTRNPETK